MYCKSLHILSVLPYTGVGDLNFQILDIWQDQKITPFCHYYSRVGRSYVVRQLVTIKVVTIKEGG